MVEWFAGCAKGLGAVNNCLVRSVYSSANQRNAEQALLLQWRESTKSWNIDQGPSATLLKTHCDAEDSSMDQDDSAEVMVQLLGSLPTLNVNDGRATVDRGDEPFVPMGHHPVGEDEVKVLYVDAREQTADRSFVCANVTQIVQEASGEQDDLVTICRQRMDDNLFENDWSDFEEVTMENLIQGVSNLMQQSMGRGLVAAEHPNTNSLSNMGTTGNDGVDGPSAIHVSQTVTCVSCTPSQKCRPFER